MPVVAPQWRQGGAPSESWSALVAQGSGMRLVCSKFVVKPGSIGQSHRGIIGWCSICVDGLALRNQQSSASLTDWMGARALTLPIRPQRASLAGALAGTTVKLVTASQRSSPMSCQAGR
ncbi:hypothetical protein ACCO45_000337 [Purpureocillium lilacinum]|uniref:Uncharacterized protein n=1 Tax=Purpureocillium lilacinum TaxID=33203 RepID=A0ACC4E546_PURLI